MSINKWVGTGNLARDPELKATSGGTQVISFTVAVNERIKKGNEWQDYTNWVDCVMYGNRAQSLARLLKKGTKVAVEGKWHQDRWEKDGQKRSRWEVVLSEVELMQQKDDQQQDQQQQTLADAYDEDIPF